MAKQYYNVEEAQKKLKTDEDGLRILVRQGRLREFRDSGKLNYRVEEVDAIVAERSGSADSGELVLEPADDSGIAPSPPPADDPGLSASFGGSSILSLEDTETGATDASAVGAKAPGRSGPEPSLDDSGSGSAAPPAKAGSGSGARLGDSDLALSGSDVLSLDEVDTETVEGMRKDDTVITNVGISVFDDDDLEIAADPMAKTIATGGDEHLGLDGSGAGSGLLDLTRESDDTSLGADVLGDIELADDAATQTLEATEATELQQEPMAAEEAVAGPVALGQPVAVSMGVAVFPRDPSAPIFSGLLVAGMMTLALAGAVAAATTYGVWPTYLGAIDSNLLIFFAGTVAAGGLFALIGWLVGRPSTPRPAKAKAKKEKPEAKAKAKRGKAG
ncbi:MAG: helix-turn-helix domain-containing protein [Phycisphaerae bacterium]|nr:helix-turn-helix domain-containing protein [Phycisphaerae bacterium]